VSDLILPVPSGPLSAEVVTVSTYGAAMDLPGFVIGAGESAARLTFEFFTARIPNKHTRDAYGHAIKRFCAWASAGGLTLQGLSAVHVAAYVEYLGRDVAEGGGGLRAPSVKQHFAGIRHWLDYLTQKGVLPFNPALSVRGPRYSRKEGLTPALEPSEAKKLFDSITGSDVVSLRDKALLAVLLFAVSRVTAACTMRVRDYDEAGDGWLVLHAKGGKTRRIAAHHKLRDYLRAYLAAANLSAAENGKAYLFQSAPARSGRLSGLPMHRNDVGEMVKRRLKAAGLSTSFRTHSFRTTGANFHLNNGGKLEHLQGLMDHEDISTTRGYVRGVSGGERSEVERIHW
jgi:integrase/recombinase XerD